jgi:hypothetical protein
MNTTSVAPDAERPVDKAPETPDTPETPETPVLKPPVPPRIRWRVVVRTGGQGKMDPSRPSRPLAWHLASCTASEDPEVHCPEGRRLLAAGDDPDGHCLLDGVCPRCDMQK